MQLRQNIDECKLFGNQNRFCLAFLLYAYLKNSIFQLNVTPQFSKNKIKMYSNSSMLLYRYYI